ncbi:MAG: serine hydrolase [Chitinophagales bacterium]|nr:serine hydrolase [Chitinophagales bacterium]
MKNKYDILRHLFIALFVLCPSFMKAQSGINPAYAALLQNALDSLREAYDVKGISAAAYIPGKGIWQGVTGVSYGSHDIDTTMIFDIGSTTKTFVAAEIFKLIEEGMFGLDDTLFDLLPPIEYVTPEVTVRQLLGHKSGLGEYLNIAWQNAMFDDLERTWYSPEAMDSFLTAPTGVPGGTWNYRNTNYVLLGMIAETFRGDSLHSILRNDFLTPLSLNDTYMETFETYDNPIPDNWSTPTMDPDLAVNVSSYPHEAMYSSTSFAGGFFSSAADLANWGYNLYSGNVLSETSLAEMLTFTNVPGGYFTGYGLGSMRFAADGNIYWGHAGNFFGYAASMIYDPEDSVCVALLVNQDCFSPYIAMPLMNIAMNNLSLATNLETNIPEKKMKVYPNPANDVLYIEMPEELRTNYTIQLFDMAGEMVYTEQQNKQNIFIHVNNINDGFYVLKIIAGSNMYAEKLVIEH